MSEDEFAYLNNEKEPENLEYLTDGQKIDLGGRTLEVIETPGHTHGCVCFLDVTNGYLFAGDTGCNREILVYFDHSATVEDVKLSDEKLLARKAEYTRYGLDIMNALWLRPAWKIIGKPQRIFWKIPESVRKYRLIRGIKSYIITIL